MLKEIKCIKVISPDLVHLESELVDIKLKMVRFRKENLCVRYIECRVTTTSDDILVIDEHTDMDILKGLNSNNRNILSIQFILPSNEKLVFSQEYIHALGGVDFINRGILLEFYKSVLFDILYTDSTLVELCSSNPINGWDIDVRTRILNELEVTSTAVAESDIQIAHKDSIINKLDNLDTGVRTYGGEYSIPINVFKELKTERSIVLSDDEIDDINHFICDNPELRQMHEQSIRAVVNMAHKYTMNPKKIKIDAMGFTITIYQNIKEFRFEESCEFNKENNRVNNLRGTSLS